MVAKVGLAAVGMVTAAAQVVMLLHAARVGRGSYKRSSENE